MYHMLSALYYILHVLLFIYGLGVEPSPLLLRPFIGLLNVQQLMEWMSGRGNRSTREKSTPVSFCPSQIPHYFSRDRILTAATESRRVTVWACLAKYYIRTPDTRGFHLSWMSAVGYLLQGQGALKYCLNLARMGQRHYNKMASRQLRKHLQNLLWYNISTKCSPLVIQHIQQPLPSRRMCVISNKGGTVVTRTLIGIMYIR
jgi:hypothetical protein